MLTAFSYVRFSSKPQEHGDSVNRQVKLAREYATKHGLRLDERSYQDLGVSAWKGKNAADGALGAFLKAVDEHLIPAGSYLLVESLDRVSRAEVMEAYDTFSSIIKRGIALVTLQDEQVYTKATIGENWTKLIIALAVMARANEESVTKSKRTRSAWQSKRDAGIILTARGPSWLELQADRKAWKLIPAKVKVVQQIFKLAASGLGCPTIADRLNAKATPTMRDAPFWDPALVMSILKNRAVLGVFTPRNGTSEAVDGYYPPIIEPDIFHLCQEHIARRRHTGGPTNTGVSNLFSGLMRCECESKIRFVSSDKRKLYVRCLRAYSNMGCDAPPMPYKAIEEKIMFWLAIFEGVDFSLNPQVLVDPAVVLRGELDGKNKAYDNLLTLMEQGKEYAGGMSRVAARMATLEGEISELETAIRTAVLPVPASSAVQASIELFKRHAELQPGQELDDLRAQLQSTMRRLITKMVLRKATHHQDKLDMLYREMVLYGPLIDLLKGNEYWEIWDKTEDGGLVQDYTLEGGMAGAKRRKQIKRAARTTKV